MHDLEQLIPIAVGSILSPLPIAAIIAILLAPRARANSAAYAAGAVIVTSLLVLVTALTTHGAGSGRSSGDDVIVLVLGIVLTLGFAVLAFVSWFGRPKNGAEPVAPSWLTALAGLKPLSAFGFGALMAITNAKNLPLDLKAGALIGASDLPVGAVVAVSVVFAVLGSLGILLPTLLASTGSEAVSAGLARLKSELITHNAVIMTVLFAILAAVQLMHVVTALTR